MTALELLAGLTMPSGKAWGTVAAQVQRSDACAVLSERGPRRHWIGRPRGYSKTEDLAALTTVALLELLEPGREAYCAARDRDQARILVDRVRGFVRRSGLEGAFEHLGPYVIVSQSGARLEALSCDVGSAWGLSPAWCVIDELCQWPETPAARDLFDAITSGLPKVAGSRLAIITTAGSPGHWSRDVFSRAEREPSWHVSMTHTPAPWMDRDEIDEARRNLPASSFARLFANHWAQGEDRLFNAADLDACFVLEGPLDYDSSRTYAVGVDLALRNDRAAVVTGHVDGHEVSAPLVVDQLDVFAPSKGRDIDLERVEQLVEARSHQYHAPVVFDPAQAWQMMQRLTRRAVRVHEHVFSAASNSRRTLLLLQLVREQQLRLPEDRDLRDEMLNLRIREVSPGQFRYDHDAARHDDRVTALSLVVDHLCSRISAPAEVYLPSGRLPRVIDSSAARSLQFGAGPSGVMRVGSIQERIGGRH
jgi:hypothetical protein